ncbi:MAG: hypothetical protein SPF92_04115 [Clostridia bacterium]|nr:hypothetical protein [Clostridia bacterium]
MKKISVLLVICMIVCTIPFASFAADVYTKSITDEGIVTYLNDFQSSDASSYSKYGIATYRGKSEPYGTFSVTGDTTNKYFMSNNTSKSIYPTFRVNFYKTDKAPKINSLADAKKYKVNFKMKLSPTSTGALTLNCGGFWKFQFYNKTYAISCNDGAVTAVDGAQTSGYSVNLEISGANPFREYEIDIDKTTNTSVFKVEGNKIFENVPLYETNDFNSLLIGYSSLKGQVFIDDIKVTVTDTASCSDTNWSEATNINFDNFEIGTIPNKENSNIGGFENGNTLYSSNGYAYIDYKYDDAAPETVDKYLKITKNAKGDEIGVNKPFSVKRDISSITENYSEYEVSFKIKNELDKNGTGFVRLGDGGSGNEGAVISISSYAIVKYRDYSVVNSNDEKAWITVSSKAEQGVWTDVKLKIYRDEKKADLYIGDMSTPAAEKIPTNHKVGGDYLVFAPQKSATGSISVDDIVINPVTEADYALTYTTGADDLAKYTSSGVTAQCKIKEGKEAPVIIIAQYGADGRLINTALSGNTEDGTVSAALSAPSAQTGEYVSIMLWKSLDNPVSLKKLIKLTPVES